MEHAHQSETFAGGPAINAPAGGLAADKNLSMAADLLKQGRGAEAKALIMAALASDPNSVPALELLGRFYMAGKDARQAVSAHRRLLEQAPSDPKSYNALGTSLVVAGQTEEALDYLRQAVALAPRNHIYQANLAKAHMMLEQWEAAIAHLEKACQFSQGEARAQFMALKDMCRNQMLENALWGKRRDQA